MKPTVVVDVGNTRLKWGLCLSQGLGETVSLPPGEPAAWEEQGRRWQLAAPVSWVVAGVHPQQCERFREWLQQRGEAFRFLTNYRQLPVQVPLDQPHRVGIDRLLNAVAANTRRSAGIPALIVDAGSAVTVDWLDEQGAFRGGAILPGLNLMLRALHDYTALLPLLAVPRAAPRAPGTSTTEAMETGVYWAVAGGIQALVEQMTMIAGLAPDLFFTGGDAALLRPVLGDPVHLWPEMTLEGIRLSAEALL
jgi:type III pantothenate kinase